MAWCPGRHQAIIKTIDDWQQQFLRHSIPAMIEICTADFWWEAFLILKRYYLEPIKHIYDRQVLPKVNSIDTCWIWTKYMYATGKIYPEHSEKYDKITKSRPKAVTSSLPDVYNHKMLGLFYCKHVWLLDLKWTNALCHNWDQYPTIMMPMKKIITFFWISVCCWSPPGETQFMWAGGHIKNTYELLNLRALKFLPVNKIHIFQCMGKIFCVGFQRYPLKFHTKYLTHTLKDMIFTQHWNFKSS